MCFLFSGSTVRTPSSLARDSAVMIEAYLPFNMALSLPDATIYVTNESETSLVANRGVGVEHTSGLALNVSYSSLLKKLASVSFSAVHQ